MEKYIVAIKQDGTIEKIKVVKDGNFLYAKVRSVIGGYMENVSVLNLPEEYILVVDEEGKLKSKPKNKKASIIYGKSSDYIVGDAAILKLGEYEGEQDILSYSEEEADKVINIINEGVKDATIPFGILNDVAGRICNKYCIHNQTAKNEEELYDKCTNCPFGDLISYMWID